MEGIDLSFPSYAQHERMAAALEAIALNGGQNSAEALDAACRQLLDGTNTTRVFWSWYPRALAAGETDKYKLLSRFATAAAQAWNGKTYTLRSYDPSVSGITKMTPMDDLADKAAAQLCTENTEAVEDWADEDPMTWYIRANALSLEDGTMNITYFEGEDGFDITGEDAPVYTFALALWIKEWNDGTYDYISFRTTRGSGYYPDAGDVDPKNKKRLITWHATFPGGEVNVNEAENRLQLIFADKPDADTRQALKSEGFKWASSQGAWQRQLNQNAIRAAARLDFLRPEDGKSPYQLQPFAKRAEKDVSR